MKHLIAWALAAALLYFVHDAFAGGSHSQAPAPGASAASAAVSSAIAGGVGIGGSGGGSATASTGKTMAIGFGSTGLTSTAPCLGSFSAAFGIAAGTQVEQGCVLRHYAETFCPNVENEFECRRVFACADPDLLEAARTYLGCAPRSEQ